MYLERIHSISTIAFGRSTRLLTKSQLYVALLLIYNTILIIQLEQLHEEIQTLEKALRAEMKSVVAPGLSPDHVLEIRTSILSYRRRLMDVKQQVGMQSVSRI